VKEAVFLALVLAQLLSTFQKLGAEYGLVPGAAWLVPRGWLGSVG